MKPHEQRVVDEATELNEKIVKLATFTTSSPIFDALEKEDQILLNRQLGYMTGYSETLAARIARFK